MKLVELFETREYDDMSEKQQLAAVRRYPWDIEKISNPSEEVQFAVIKDGYCYRIEDIHNPTKNVANFVLTNENFIKEFPEKYETFVHRYFKDNTLLINKWLRYAENMRNMS